ncbi:MAG: hypothetical protein AAF226_14355 [Verrucomicrobiota bacterium]
MRFPKTFFTLLLLAGLSLSSLAKAQDATRQAIDAVKQLEQALKLQFAAQFDPLTKTITASVIHNQRVVSGATLINPETGTFVMTGDATMNAEGAVKVFYKGKFVDITPKWLSEKDNLAIATIEVPKVIQIHFAEAPTGSLVGLPLTSHSWITGSITTEARSVEKEDASVNSTALEKHWERIGLKVNDIRVGFPLVFETDLPLTPTSAGMPVITMDGKVAGIAIARADHHSTLVIPAKRVLDLIEESQP